jgi:hypothetical protein
MINSATGEVKTAQDAIDLMVTAPIFSQLSSKALIAEAGLNFTEIYKTPEELVKFLGFAPGILISGGKKIGIDVTKGNKHFKEYMVNAAASFFQQKNPNVGHALLEWGKQYRRATSQQKAVIAMSRKAIVAVWYMIHKNEPFNESGYNWDKGHIVVRSNISKAINAANNLERYKDIAIDSKDLQTLTNATQKLNEMVGLKTLDFEVKSFESQPLTETSLGKRYITALIKHNIFTTNDLLVRVLSGSLIGLKGVGNKSLDTIIEFLEQEKIIVNKGVKLKTELPIKLLVKEQ